ncbi:MAG: hypothetical protein Q8N08_03430 [Methanobacteriaceae archaeon]|nr:hypothetical protein [Methanobacteriaceae archaeon]
MGDYYSAENAKKDDLKYGSKYFSTENYFKDSIDDEVPANEPVYSKKEYLRNKTREMIWLTARVRFRCKFGYNKEFL